MSADGGLAGRQLFHKCVHRSQNHKSHSENTHSYVSQQQIAMNMTLPLFWAVMPHSLLDMYK